MKFYARQRRMPQVIIVSLIDIFAILLIFVIVTSTFRREQPSVNIKLPEAKTAVASDQPGEAMVLSVTENEDIYVDDKKVSVEELRSILADLVHKNAKQTLALNADTKAPFGTIIRVLDVLRDAGVKGNLAAFMENKK